MEIYKYNIKEKSFADPMQFRSNLTIATICYNGNILELKTKGKVKIKWDEDGYPQLGKTYTDPYKFPAALKKLIKNNPLWVLDNRIEVVSTNYFVLYLNGNIINDTEKYIDNIEEFNNITIKNFLIKMYNLLVL